MRYLQFFPERDEVVVRSYNVLSRAHNHSSDLTLSHCMRGRKACADAWRNGSTADGVDGRGVWYSSANAPGGTPSLRVQPTREPSWLRARRADAWAELAATWLRAGK